MTITYEQAMATLKSMFGAADTAVLHAVLEQNGGHMERTVDMLLQMNIPMGGPSDNPPASGNAGPADAPTPSSAPASGPGPSPPAGPPPDASKRSSSNSGKSRAPKNPGDWSQGLPEDFLRPPSYFAKHGGVHDKRLDEDAQLAQMLQDQLFMEDLMRNPDYYFGGRPHRRHRHHHQQPHPQPQPMPQQPQPMPQQPMVDPAMPAPVGPLGGPDAAVDAAGVADEHDLPPPSAHSATFKEKFAKLGEAAKERLRKIASAFSRNKGNGPKDGGLDYMSLPSLDDAARSEDIHLGMDDGQPAIELQDRRQKKNGHEFDDEL